MRFLTFAGVFLHNNLDAANFDIKVSAKMHKIAIGYRAICDQLQLNVLPHYRDSYIIKHGRAKSFVYDHYEIHLYQKAYALKNENDLLENLEFALKYDGINLEIIKGLFENIDKKLIENYIRNQQTSIYSRRIWFLFEYLMNKQLNLKDCQRIKYVDLIDPKLYVTSTSIKSSRHAINNNLLGDHKFCPVVRRTGLLDKYIAMDLAKEARSLVQKYDPHLVSRASNYLYMKETMSSYQIEREQPDKSRMARFINILQQAATIETLSKEKFIELQNLIVDPRFQNIDYRHDQNYVGENINPYFQKLHYIPPKPDDVPDLMQGLLDSLNRMLAGSVDPMIIAAIIAFGFVLIHPFEDGNGRIHRFLIHYILAKNSVTPNNIIFPISFVMLQNLQQYDMVLESFSKPLLSALTNYNLSNEGVLTVHQETKSFYQYIDFTFISEYLFKCLDEIIHTYLKLELDFISNYDKTKQAIQDIIDMPDKKIDLFIKCVLQNNGRLSDEKHNKFFFMLNGDEVVQLCEVVKQNMIKSH